MILADTSIWVDYLRRGNSRFASVLDEAAVICHPFVVGELACGGIRNRAEVLKLLKALPSAVVASQSEALALVEWAGLSGRGLGWIDVHLLASARLSGCKIWSLDKAVREAAETMAMSAPL